MFVIMTGYRGDGQKRIGKVVPSRYPSAELVTVECLRRGVVRSYRLDRCDNLVVLSWGLVAWFVFLLGV